MKCFLILICISASAYSTFPNGARISTKIGKLIGTTRTLPNGRTVYAFLGVPFAAPPIGLLRFEEPRPVKPWLGYKNASTPSKMCVQFFIKTSLSKLIGEEDCLYLDIYTPQLPNEGRKKGIKLMNVMVYIFGGGFSYGNCQRLAPDYILQDEDIVFVCINYRVGPFGFLSSGDEIMPGNNGLKDQIEALKWIRENIRNFGGDPSQVTLYGTSSGAISTQLLSLSPLSKGLFKNAILSSGSSLLPWLLRPIVSENSIRLASSVQCPTLDSRLMLSCLRNKPVERLFEASHQFYTGLNPSDIPFTPVIEPKFKRAFLSEHPYELLKRGHVTDVPLMVGIVEQEGGSLTGLLYDKNKLTELNDKWHALAPRLLHYDYVNDSSRRDHISTSVRDYYFGRKAISKETGKQLLKLIGDRLFSNGIIASTKLNSATISKNIYCYKLYYRGSGSHCNHHPDPIKKNYGSCHGDDQLYLVSFTDGDRYNDNVKSRVDLDMVSLSSSSIFAFMKNGNPSTPDVQWEPLKKNGTMNCLNIYSYTHQRMLDIENTADTKFWRDVLRSEY